MEACTVTPDYFRAMNIPLLRGRYFTDQDNRAFIAGRDQSKLNEGERLISGSNVIIVDEVFARQHWPGEEAVGKRIRFGATQRRRRSSCGSCRPGKDGKLERRLKSRAGLFFVLADSVQRHDCDHRVTEIQIN